MTHQRVYRGRIVGLVLVSIALVVGLAACSEGEEAGDTFDIAVYVPGVVAGSPTYEMMAAGVQQAVDERSNATYKLLEGGFNQGEWENGVTSLAATGQYELIVTSNPSMPEIAERVSATFPEQAFLVLDGYLEGHPRIHTVMFNQTEQAFLSGYFAGLVTQSDMEFANEAPSAGLLAGQEYPIMNDVILPGFELGLDTVVGAGTVDFRVLGNWFDAARATELANGMIGNGIDVILAIAGSGNQGVIAAAQENGAYVLWYDSAGYDQAPGTVVGSTVVRLDRAAYERSLAAIDGELEMGIAEVLGVGDGYVDFADEDPAYRRAVPESVRGEMQDILARMRSGQVAFDMPIN